MPWATAPDLLEAILPDLPPSILVGGHVLLWPAKGSTSRSKLFMRPEGENLLGFGILPAIPPRYWEDAKPMLDVASRLSIAMGGKRYLSGYVEFTPDEWRVGGRDLVGSQTLQPVKIRAPQDEMDGAELRPVERARRPFDASFYLELARRRLRGRDRPSHFFAGRSKWPRRLRWWSGLCR